MKGKKKMKFDTVLFDLDGTILDTNKLIHDSFVYTFEQYGYEFTDEQILQFNGPPLYDTFTKLNPEKAEEMVQIYRKHNLSNHDKVVKLFPNVKETLDALQNNGVKMGIISAKMRPGVIQGLELTKIKDYFDTIITFDDITKPKPDPEPVLMGMEKLNSVKNKTIMIGDNFHDIVAGNEAGVDTVAVSWTSKGIENLQKYNPTYTIDDMLELLPIVGV